MSEDQKNVDLILLTIGVLIGVAVGLFVIARDMGNETQDRMMMNDPEVQAVVDQRIAPAGRVVLDGETVDDEADVAAVVGAEAAPAKMTGPQVYNAACLACHGGGIRWCAKDGRQSCMGTAYRTGYGYVECQRD